MKIIRIPQSIQAILFDMDGTLYTHEEYLRLQLTLPVQRLAKLQGKSFDEMNSEIEAYRRRYAAENGGRKTSLGNAFTAFGISITESARWREELYQPERYLSTDQKLHITLSRLAGSYTLALVTNNPVSIAKRTLAALGAGEFFSVIVGHDTCGVSKPHKAPFRKAAENCPPTTGGAIAGGTAAENCLAVGDRYDMDIVPPLELGMGGIVVDGVEDVYLLPELLLSSNAHPPAVLKKPQ